MTNSCFYDIISTCIKNKGYVVFAVVTGIILTICQLGRSYYIGLIAKNLDKRDVLKYIIIVAVSYIASVAMYLKTNREQLTIIKNISKDLVIYFLKLILRKL